jgi:hypothetical protein
MVLYKIKNLQVDHFEIELKNVSGQVGDVAE